MSNLVNVQEAIGDKNKKISELNAELGTIKSNSAAAEERVKKLQDQLGQSPFFAMLM